MFVWLFVSVRWCLFLPHPIVSFTIVSTRAPHWGVTWCVCVCRCVCVCDLIQVVFLSFISSWVFHKIDFVCGLVWVFCCPSLSLPACWSLFLVALWLSQHTVFKSTVVFSPSSMCPLFCCPISPCCPSTPKLWYLGLKYTQTHT